MPLAFDDHQLLIPGVHDASLQEVEEHFARFQKSDRRLRLFQKLQEYVDALKKAQCAVALIVDGSFVMACVDKPEDIDLILVLPADWDMDADLKPYQYGVVSKRRIKKEYGFDVFVVRAGSVEEQDWTRFFSRVNVKWCEEFGWPERSSKGVVRIML
jgi:hypothetical protein